MPLISQVYGFGHHVKICDLTAADVLEIVCADCSHKYMVPPYQLYLRFNPSMSLVSLPDRFRCKQCGCRGRARYYVYRAECLAREVR